jgi:3-oxoadipate enol-lactonase
MTPIDRRSGFASANGAQVYYEIAGSGPAVVFVHAGIADSRMWDEQFYTFAGDFRVLRYDLRGFGQTAPVAGEFSHYDDLRALLDALDIRQAALVGCSKGGTAAMDFALAYPQRATALVMASSTPSGYQSEDEAPPPFWDDLVAAWKAGELDRVAEFEVRLWVDGHTRTPDQVDGAIRDKVRAMNLIALRNEKLGLGQERPLDPPAMERLAELSIPVMALVGDLDMPDIIAAARLMAGQIAGARQVIMSGAAHLPNMEQPAQFNRIVGEFLVENLA